MEKRTVLEFSSADSLESTVSLVSGVRSQSEVTEVLVDPERGTREKRYKDGRREIWYSNGNRKEIGSDGKTVKVSEDFHNVECGYLSFIMRIANLAIPSVYLQFCFYSQLDDFSNLVLLRISNFIESLSHSHFTVVHSRTLLSTKILLKVSNSIGN